MKLDTTNPICYNLLKVYEGGYSKCLGKLYAKDVEKSLGRRELIDSGVMIAENRIARDIKENTMNAKGESAKIVVKKLLAEPSDVESVIIKRGSKLILVLKTLIGKGALLRQPRDMFICELNNLVTKDIPIVPNILLFGRKLTANLYLKVGSFIISMVSRMIIVLKIYSLYLEENITNIHSHLSNLIKTASCNLKGNLLQPVIGQANKT